MRRRGIEPRPIAWKAIMLTTTPTPLFSGNQDASLCQLGQICNNEHLAGLFKYTDT